MRGKASIEVGDNHRRGIATTLTLLDEVLSEIEEWASGREVNSVLYVEHNSLSEHQRRQLKTAIADTRLVVRRLQAALRLQPTEHSVAQMIWARCSGLREHVIELHAKHLRRYGEVDGRTQQRLDPAVSQLVSCVDRMLRIVAAPTDDPTQEESGERER